MAHWEAFAFSSSAFSPSNIQSQCTGAHKLTEIDLRRHGHVAHLTYLTFGVATNMLVGACLVLGGSQVAADVSGVNIYGACFLSSLVVAIYVIVGGLQSTFAADYLHTVILFVASLGGDADLWQRAGLLSLQLSVTNLYLGISLAEKLTVKTPAILHCIPHFRFCFRRGVTITNT